ncbi:MAG TPA: serine protease, partial [Usitatibacter sp.]|nr:serine protease [Usitatibacter sp.]
MNRSIVIALFVLAFASEGAAETTPHPLASAAHLSLEMPSRAFDGAPSAPATFRAPELIATSAAALERLQEKRLASNAEEPSGRMRVATVRALPKAAHVDTWSAVEGGYVTRLRVSSEGAEGLRVKLELGDLPEAIEVRVQGSDDRIESMPIEPTFASEAWTPWTVGSSQLIEIFSPVVPSEGALLVGAILHFTQSPFAKAAAGACTIRTLCSSGDPALDAAIADAKKAVMRLTFVENGSGFLCTATLINTERYPAAFVLTANHCINNAAAASSISTMWFYESTTCGTEGVLNPGFVQISGGMQLVFTNYNVDSTLLLMNQTPPAGAVYSAWNPARLASGNPVVSISHPAGDTTRYATGAITKEYRIQGRPQDMYGVAFSRGIIQGGSSGSGLFTLSGRSLQLRGVLSGSTIRTAGGMSCTDLTEEALYARLEIFEPEIDQYIRIAPQAPDDAPNRPQDLFSAPVTDPNGVDLALNLRSTPLVFNSLRIDYPGDLDVFRFFLTAPATVSLGSEGALDTVGTLLDSQGVSIEANDDVAAGNVNFGITRH